MEIATNAGTLKTALETNEEANGNDGAWPTLDFTFSEALMPELAKLAPLPNMIVSTARIIAMQRHLADMVALDRNVAVHPTLSIATSRVNIKKTWIDNARGMLPIFEKAVEDLKYYLADEGRSAFGEAEWQQIETSILPS